MSGAQRHIGQVDSAHQLTAPDGQNIGVVTAAELGVMKQLVHQGRVVGDGDLHELHLLRHQALKHRRFALDNQLAPTLKLPEPIQPTLHQQLVAALQRGLATREGFRAAAALQG